MSANTLLTSVLNAGTNTHTTTSEEANVIPTDFITSGVVGAITLNSGSGGTGSFCVNADTSPDMGVTIKAGQAYIQATPSSQNSQVLRTRAAADYTTYVINSNASGSTKYDWIYLQINAANANNPSADGSNVASFVTSRSSSNTSDTGSPPTYGILLAVVTVVNGASSITNSNITDRRVQAAIGGANSALSTFLSEGAYDYIASGLVWSGDAYASTLAGSMTSGVVYIGGGRNLVIAVTGHTFTASKDTYVDVLYNSSGTGSVVYTEVTNNAASPALAASSIRIGVVVTGAGNINSVASINQGQETKLLPIASSRPYAVTDSLGNLICPRDPNRRTLGLAQTTASLSTASTSVQASAILICPVIIPTGRKIKISFSADNGFSSSASGYAEVSIWDGVAGSGTQLRALTGGSTAANGQAPFGGFVIFTPAAATKTYSIGYRAEIAGTATVTGSSTSPIEFQVELA